MSDTERAEVILADLRKSIDNLDAVLVHTLAERFRCTQTVGKLKAEHTLPPSDPAREARQIERLERMCANAEAILDRIESHAALEAVKYPGIGFIIGLTFTDGTKAEAFINDCPAIFASTSFGGVHTSAERRARWGDDVPDGFVRLSVGCEPTAQLVGAIEDSLNAL